MTRPLLSRRAELPALEGCVYLNSNSTGPMPEAALALLDAHARVLRGWRDSVWERWWAELHAYADAVAALLGAPKGSVWTDGSASHLLGRLLTGLELRASRNRLVTTSLEFPSAAFILRAFERVGAEVVVVPSRDGRAIDEDALEAAVDERTLLVCASHATYATGALLDVPRLVRRAREVGALVAVDAYASVGVVPVDVAALGVDVLLGGARKWLCGAYDSAFCYVRPEVAATLRPLATGWMATRDPLSFGHATEWADGARRLAAGTPSVLPAQLSRPGLDMIAEAGVASIRAASLSLTELVIARADEAGLEVVTPREPERRGGIVALRFPGDAKVHAELLRRGFVTSHRGALRIGPHAFNTEDEVSRLMDQVVALAREARA